VSLREATLAASSGCEVPGAVLEAAFGEMLDGGATPAQMAGLLVALRTKGETVGEIVAVARALRARATTAPCSDPRTVDTCGTGGDRRGSFNISTTAAFVVAGAGVPVAKHGNRAASSRAGSADVLEALGVRVDLPVERAAGVLAEVGVAFFFARSAHPGLRRLAPVRAELGIPTVLNCVGPLLNPLGVRRQLVGVYTPELLEPLARALAALGSERVLTVHGCDGLDEITSAGPTRTARLDAGRISSGEIDPAALGIPPPPADALRGGDVHENAKILLEVLEGARGARRDVVLLNAAAALEVAGAVADLSEGLTRARQSLDSGAARQRLARLVEASAA
jgi:anthranilate phosphoribosyltransferase